MCGGHRNLHLVLLFVCEVICSHFAAVYISLAYTFHEMEQMGSLPSLLPKSVIIIQNLLHKY